MLDRLRRHAAIAVVGAVARDNQILPHVIVADPLQQSAAGDVPAFERAEVDDAVLAGLDRLGDDRRSRQLCKQKNQGPDHDRSSST
jgi:hypothetical protein